jgi:potassium intermediate/small conductance calcium-activated channel subfamily N protein 2
MSTVGYGEIVAKTNEGRTIAMMACIVGVFLISMMIISVNKILSMSSTELNMLLILERIYSNKDLENSAKDVLLQFSKIIKSKRSKDNE